MTSYDSDSSDGGEFTETNVLLGYASKDLQDETISKLGGIPEWLEADKPPSAALARCKVCGNLMVLILQLNAELPERFPGHDRRLYVFACKRESCRRKPGSIRALRGVRIWADDTAAAPATEAEEGPKKQEASPRDGDGLALGDALFGGQAIGGGSGANPFSSNANPFSTGSGNPFNTTPSQGRLGLHQQGHVARGDARPASASLSKTFAESLALGTGTGTGPTGPAPPAPPPEPWPESSALPKPYPTLYLAEADYETLEPASTKIPDNARVEEVDAPETVSALDREAFESSMDAAFQRFADRLAQNPDQVIRYEFAGTPLLYSRTDAVGEKLTKGSIPGCPSCGGKRTFEVQLTPNAIAELEADDLSLEGMEWGTIIVGVCERDCVPGHIGKDEAGYLEEWAGVQWEELTKQK
ncbi:PDCD2-C domain protein [Metarhizium album ARSEF 1941]|uniref:PDCD2-C domain protein n=1 Tax=Metarhizium album (strain ARSEF 1941) TaxID=1081103 RepID=A0A0B2WXK7_METAS|nr:PDCD2-C domain protein [Metarhizium album ARSEF 1941]KHO01027.1 PDCD2-C domain protein [Metarhizium album ARSEF 1941]